MPRISVLMPAHNAERYIRKAVRSALKSLPADAEVVVLDDASSDHTFRAVDRMRDRRVRVEAVGTNLGTPGAMRWLLSNSDSEFVARLDADDIAMPRRFPQQLAEIEAGADVSFGKLMFFGKGYEGPKVQNSARLSPDQVALALLIGCPLGHSTMLGKRSVFGDFAYPDCRAEDYTTWMHIAARGHRIVMSDQPFAKYRKHVGQLTQNVDWRAQRSRDADLVREAYDALSRRVLGFTPSPEHPIWGSWAPDTTADQAVVDEIVRRVRTLGEGPRAHLTTMLGWHGQAERVAADE